MSNTEELVGRFWRTMSERYGSRWVETFTDQPTRAWRDCLAPFSPRDIQRAIDALSLKEATKQFPPTEPEFRSLLQIAARGNSKPTEDAGELRRGYWRSTIIHAVSQGLGYTFATFEPVLIANKPSLGRACKDLLDECDELELATGQRTRGQEDHCEQRCREIVVAFKQLKAALKVAA